MKTRNIREVDRDPDTITDTIITIAIIHDPLLDASILQEVVLPHLKKLQ